MTVVLHTTKNIVWAAAADAGFACRRAMLALICAGRPYVSEARASLAGLIENSRPRPAHIRLQDATLGIAGQWQRATGIIHSALTSFRNIETLQAAAARQIDAADYALQLLLQDLSAAMPIPADGRALRAVLAEAAKAPAPAARQKKPLAA